ncbi:AraC family transcriptional regulator [Anaerosporobacter faecicola]|uniref:AraC family transcriptional regulator n=1 Tax=Anaerosporobacter faecicola TaxID=2718714 RepID=UPI001439ABD2|nr:AraC family transcriptional regulator [Anaerosporobacter faecicola]
MYFCLNTDLLPKVSYIGRTITPKHWVHHNRNSEEYLLYLIHSGTLYVQERGIKFALHAGDMLLLEPGFSHEGYQESSCDYYAIHFSADTFTTFDCSQFDTIESTLLANKRLFYNCDPLSYEPYTKSRLFIPKDLRITDSSVFEQVEQGIQEAIFSYEEQNEHFKLICSCKLIEILTLLSNYFSNKVLRDPAGQHSMAVHLSKTQELLAYLRKSYQEKLTGEQIAKEMNMNFDYLNRIFKKQTGFTIFAYLLTIRINKAKELLLHGTMKSYEIARVVGFRDEYHFSKAFKKSVGLTPTQFLQHVKED